MSARCVPSDTVCRSGTPPGHGTACPEQYGVPGRLLSGVTLAGAQALPPSDHLPKLFKQRWLAVCFPRFLGREGVSPPFPWAQPQVSGMFIGPSFRGEAEARLYWEAGLPCGAGRDEVSLCPVCFRSCRMTFHSLTFEARVGLLASPLTASRSKTLLPLRQPCV